MKGRRSAVRALRREQLVEIEGGIRSGAALGVETLISVNSGRGSSIGRHSLGSEDERRGSMVSTQVSLVVVRGEGSAYQGNLALWK